MSLAQWSASHRRSILFLFAMLTLGGAISFFSLPVTLFPHAEFPRVVVTLEAGDRPADQMEIAVTRMVEQALRPLPGVVSMRSDSSRGSAEISVNFRWGEDMPRALLAVQGAVGQLLPELPAGTRFTARRMDPTVFPVLAYSITADHLSQVQLRDIGELQLSPLLSPLPGVAKIDVLGGDTAELRVEADADKLNAYGLTLADLGQALAANNILQAVGRLEDHYKLFLVMVDNQLQSLDAIRHTVLKSGADGTVRVGDVARIFPAAAPRWQKISADGKDAVLLMVYQQPGANSIQIKRAVDRCLTGIQGQLPADVRIANWYDQSELVLAAAASVRDAIGIGAALAGLVLLLFLRNMKITLIAILAVPAVLASTVLLLLALDASFNIMTLGGMAAAVGLIVDDAIVMIEHIVRRLRESGETEHSMLVRRVRLAAIEFGRPLLGSSAATIIIFVPLAFLSGVTGTFFQALSLTMACALVISFALAWLAVPLLAEHLLHAKDAAVEDLSPWFRRLQRGYRNALNRLQRRPLLLFIGVLPLLSAGVLAYLNAGSGFMPHMDEGGFVLDYRAGPGTSLSETDRLLRQVEKILQDNPAVATYSRRTGAQMGGSITEADQGDYFIRLKPQPRAPIDQVMDDIRTEIETHVPGLDIDMALLMEDLIGDLTAVPQPIEVKLYSNDYAQLLELAPRVAETIGDIAGVVDVRSGVVLAGDALVVTVDREKAALEGVDPDIVRQQLAAWYDGNVVTQIQQGIKQVGLRVWVAPGQRATQTQLPDIWLRAPDGHRFPLRRVATVHAATGQPQISRENMRRMVAITGRISNRDLGGTIRDVKAMLSRPGVLAPGVSYELGGLYEQQQIAFRDLTRVFVAALALVLLLLLFLYEDFAAACAVLLMPLLATAGVFVGLWITGTELNITAMMGMTMIIGIVTEIAIFYFSEYFLLRRDGMDSATALIEAGSNRLRPIVMTTLAAILALMPLALGWGEGAAMQQPLAIAIISGLIVQVPLVTLVMPVVYRLLKR